MSTVDATSLRRSAAEAVLADIERSSAWITKRLTASLKRPNACGSATTSGNRRFQDELALYEAEIVARARWAAALADLAGALERIGTVTDGQR